MSNCSQFHARWICDCFVFTLVFGMPFATQMRLYEACPILMDKMSSWYSLSLWLSLKRKDWQQGKQQIFPLPPLCDGDSPHKRPVMRGAFPSKMSSRISVWYATLMQRSLAIPLFYQNEIHHLNEKNTNETVWLIAPLYYNVLTQCGLRHLYTSANKVIIESDDDLSPIRHQAITCIKC